MNDFYFTQAVPPIRFYFFNQLDPNGAESISCLIEYAFLVLYYFFIWHPYDCWYFFSYEFIQVFKICLSLVFWFFVLVFWFLFVASLSFRRLYLLFWLFYFLFFYRLGFFFCLLGYYFKFLFFRIFCFLNFLNWHENLLRNINWFVLKTQTSRFFGDGGVLSHYNH